MILNKHLTYISLSLSQVVDIQFLKNENALGKVILPNNNEILAFLSYFQSEFSTDHKSSQPLIQSLPDVKRTATEYEELDDNTYVNLYCRHPRGSLLVGLVHGYEAFDIFKGL